jgi:hypothetical protein
MDVCNAGNANEQVASTKLKCASSVEIGGIGNT